MKVLLMRVTTYQKMKMRIWSVLLNSLFKNLRQKKYTQAIQSIPRMMK
uniref:Uncharacterized protein n=1 Tax=Solanum lycopersicum TaxID=4081 RepID=A0A3Q7ER38_SOLLC